MEKFVWIGKYQEDFSNSRFNFFGSITTYGNSEKYKFVFENSNSKNELQYVLEKISFFHSIDPTIVFCFYDQMFAYKIKQLSNISLNIICINNYEILKWLSNKAIVREWFCTDIKTTPFSIMSAEECNLTNLSQTFRGYESFIAQKMVSYGGNGTYLLNKDFQLKKGTDLFMVSPYYDNTIPVNVTIIVSNNFYKIFPISIQIIDFIEQKFLYKGADFLSAKTLEPKIRKKIENASQIIAKKLDFLNYRGICGIDFLIYNDDLYFLEINSRFQASSFLIEHALKKQNLSLFDLHYDAFYQNSNFQTLCKQDISIDYNYLKDDSLTLTTNNISANHKVAFDNAGKRLIYDCPLMTISYDYNSNDYYDYFANIYHLMIPNWEEKINSQGKILAKIILDFAQINVSKILDCTCGIGIQAFSLTKEGFNVTGSDISKKEIEFATNEAQKRNLKIKFLWADCRYLEDSTQEIFDAIISIDSALPHLITKENFLLAFKSIYNRLEDGGVFLSSYRNYKEILDKKPNMAYPIRFRKKDEIEYTIFRKWEWEGDIINSKQYVIEENKYNNIVHIKKYKQWAVTEDSLFEIAKLTGFSSCYWLLPEESGFSQPIFCAVK